MNRSWFTEITLDKWDTKKLQQHIYGMSIVQGKTCHV